MAQHPKSDLVPVIIRPVFKELLYSTLTNFHVLKIGSENWLVSWQHNVDLLMEQMKQTTCKMNNWKIQSFPIS